MKEFKFVVTDPAGIHARPAGLLVKEASKYLSSITINCKGKTADAKRIFAVMSLGAKFGDELLFAIEGTDEALACENIEVFLKNNM